MNKIVRNILIAVIAIIISVIAVYMTYYYVVMNSDDNAFANLINAGNDSMGSNDYLNAIDNYNKALDYEPENKEIKDAIAHAYIMYAGTLGNGPEAIEAYNNALIYNITNTNAYWGITGIYEDNGDEDNVLATLQNGYINTGDENMKIKADNILIERERIRAEEEALAAEEAERLALEESHNDLLSKLIVLFETENPNYDDIKEMLRTDEFIQMVDEVIGKNNSFYYGARNDAGQREGKGIAVYADGYFYYGDYSADQRSGHGVYMRAVYSDSSSIGSYIFEGEWADDMPNGNGTATSNFYKDRISSAGLAKQVITGTYVNGLENGTMNLTGTTKAGGTAKYTYTVEDGVAKKSSNEDSGVKGQYIIAKSSDEKSNLTSDGSKRGVEGFVE